jgi:dienelactone hydrolase
MASRRKFLKSTAVLGSLSVIPASLRGYDNPATWPSPVEPIHGSLKSIIGSYGTWADGLAENPPSLSFRKNEWTNLDSWKTEALEKTTELIGSPDMGGIPEVNVEIKYEYDGLEIEELSWQLPYGYRTEAILLKPANATTPLPAILGLHDHGGNKYFGKRKITRTSDQMHPLMVEHQNQYYEGRAWANEIAKRGYVVLVHDTFTFASRRVRFANMSEIPWGGAATTGMTDENPEAVENIEAYNRWAGEHEHVMAKSLFCAGTTWPGVFLGEDQRALDVLAAHEEVDPDRIGCAGLSGGGLRTVYLGGMDPRIRCAACVGFMTTWSDFLLNKSYTHTWMTYTPLLPNYLDFPEIFGLRVPLPTMTLNNSQDELYTPPEMEKADKILQEIFRKAEVPDHYRAGFYPGGHKFDARMQQDAFNWFDRWLR